MKSSEIRSKFLKFFEKRGHTVIPSASLVTTDEKGITNPTLFNTAGMQPLIPYLLGEKHPSGNRLVNVQKCVRTIDIDDVGDKTHATFFEMLGNWSLGDYFKKEAIDWSYEFLTSKSEGLGLDPSRLYITVFEGDKNAEKDIESAEIWENAGVPKNRIYFKGAGDNWWPAVKSGKEDGWTGPTGPCSEMFYDITEEGLGDLTPLQFEKADSDQKIVEIWNDVFMEFEKKDGKIVSKLAQKNVDTGAGFERLVMVMQGVDNIYDTDLLKPLLEQIQKNARNYDIKSSRIIADHMRTSAFLIADGVIPSNTDRGYVLRKLIRRAVRHSHILEMEDSLEEIAKIVQKHYEKIYPNIKGQSVITIIKDEENKFRETLKNGLKEFEKGVDAFTLFSSYGFPLELTLELAKEKGVKVDIEKFNEEFKKHQSLSRSGAEQKFKGGLADTSEMSIKYHTATHLLHQALHDVLGDGVMQKGSNITPERLRFDFSYSSKMTDEEKKKVEDIVNQKIKEDLPVQSITMQRNEAEKTGARHFFGEKYGDQVSVYFIGKDIEHAYSKEFCGGPHVDRTGILGHFKIQKEEAISQDVRRIKAVLE